MKKSKFLKIISCITFLGLYLIVAIISLICSTEFFALAHNGIMSWVLAIGFEVGAMACLLSTLVLPKNKQTLTWIMFVLLTLFQCMSNTYMAYSHLDKFTGWIELFGLESMELISQKRILASISGAILPLVALGFIRIMVDMLQSPIKRNETPQEVVEEDSNENEEVVNSMQEQDVPQIEKKVVEEVPQPQEEVNVEVKKEETKPTKKEEMDVSKDTRTTKKSRVWNPSTNTYM